MISTRHKKYLSIFIFVIFITSTNFYSANKEVAQKVKASSIDDTFKMAIRSCNIEKIKEILKNNISVKLLKNSIEICNETEEMAFMLKVVRSKEEIRKLRAKYAEIRKLLNEAIQKVYFEKYKDNEFYIAIKKFDLEKVKNILKNKISDDLVDVALFELNPIKQDLDGIFYLLKKEDKITLEK